VDKVVVEIVSEGFEPTAQGLYHPGNSVSAMDLLCLIRDFRATRL